MKISNSKFQILTTPHPILVTKAERVKAFDKKLHKIILKMKKTLVATRDPVGVGLAAPQVGISLKIFLIRPRENSLISTFINPIIEHISEEENDEIIQSERIQRAKSEKRLPKKDKLLEGCLSIPNIWGYVTRKKELTLVYQDEHGKKHKKIFRGFPATIIQHEMDHFEGILFTKHILEQGEKLYRSYKNEEGEDEFEEIKI